jgi:hypothetical protein
MSMKVHGVHQDCYYAIKTGSESHTMPGFELARSAALREGWLN